MNAQGGMKVSFEEFFYEMVSALNMWRLIISSNWRFLPRAGGWRVYVFPGGFRMKYIVSVSVCLSLSVSLCLSLSLSLSVSLSLVLRFSTEPKLQSL